MALSPVLRTWRYPGGTRRDLRLDLLRGFAALAMVVDHVGGTHSWFYLVTGGNQFFVSAAESFVLIAGLTMGIVYQRLIATQGVRAAVVKALRRSWSLYLLTIALTFMFAAMSAYLQLNWAPRIGWAELPRWAFEVVTLQRTYYLVDIPLLYVLLVLMTAPLLVALARGMAWPVLAASWLLWLCWQVAPQYAHVPWPIADNVIFHFSAWQLVFVHGLVIGYEHQAIASWFARSKLQYSQILAVSGAILLVLAWLVLTQRHDGGLLAPGNVLTQQLVAKDDVTIVRIAAVVVLFVFGWSLLTLCWRPIERATEWMLMPLGQNSLTAYSLHVIVVGVLAAAAPTWTAARSAAGNASVQLLGLILVWGVIVLQPIAAEWWASRRARLVMENEVAHPVTGPVLATGGVFGRPRLMGVALCFAFTGGLAFAVTPSTPPADAPLQRAPSLPLASRTVLPGYLDVFTEPPPVPGVVAGAVQERTFYSAALGRTMPYSVYLPPGYREDTGRRFPVLYMLHGLTGDYLFEWRAYGIFNQAELLMTEGLVSRFILVLPEGEAGYWMDHAEGGPGWGTYVAHDLVNDVDSVFRTIPKRESRAVGGNSMGGHGALQLALNFPDRFGVVGAHSPTLRDFAGAPAYFGDAAYHDAHSPAPLATAFPERLQTSKLWLDVGEEDPWGPTIEVFRNLLVELEIPHRFEVLPGGHGDEYWAANLAPYLQFYAAALWSEPDEAV